MCIEYRILNIPTPQNTYAMECQRHIFSIPDNVHYLNCAYQGPYPKSVEQLGIESLKRKSTPFQITKDDYFQPCEDLKQRFSQLINAEANRIAIIPSASYGMANVANNISITARQNIVLIDEQFPSNYYPWHRLAQEHRSQIKIVAAPPIAAGRGAKWNADILDAIDNDTKVVALGNIHWADGTLFDLKAISARTKEVGAYFIVDSSQSVGALPLDVKAIQADALVNVGYKWLLGSHGIGCAYYGPEFDKGVPIEDNWINRKESDNFAKLVNYQNEYSEAAGRFNVGETSNFITTPMLIKSIEHLLEWGVENIQSYCKALVSEPIEQLRDLGCFIEEDAYRASHLFGVYLGDKIDISILKESLMAANVYVSYRGNAVRLSPNIYNNKADLDKLVEVFQSVYRQA